MHASSRRILACLTLVTTLSGIAPVAGDPIDVRIKGHSASGSIPPKKASRDGGSLSIVSEASGETEFRVAGEISDAVTSAQEAGPNGETALRVMAMPGRGGLQNVRDVLARPDVDFGIAPLPVLEAAARTDGMGNLRQRVSYVAPLYVEEVHLLAGPGIASVGELAGKPVAVGEEGGSTETVANAVLDRLGVHVEARNLDVRAAARALRDGEIAAAFVVSGKPVAVVSAFHGAHVLPLPDEKVPDGFVPAELTHADYPDLIPEGGKVRTYGTQSVLFGYSWPASSARGRLERTFVAMLMYRLPDLQVGSRHPKWREVNVAGTLPGWQRLPAMQAWLSKARPRTEGPVGETEFDAFLARTGTRATGADRESLYQDFLRWRSSPVAGGTR